MKKLNIFTPCIFLLLFCSIICVLLAYPGLNTIEAATTHQSISLESLAIKQKDLEATLEALKLDLAKTSDSLNSYNQRLSIVESNITTTQTMLVSYYMDKLSDPTYVTTYNTDYTWYTAAEALGELGKPSIPALIKRLDTTNPYERSLVFYALLLASQAENVKVFTGNDYIHTHLDFNTNTHNAQKMIALEWWEKYKSYF
ncbi:HEAT repeat domain-containing protein [Cellulosilyticum sp. WCF-2]|uniref:HEAT repeat domain-containing protein n=1 Tax=Cellulosilyticum sp. WCF-2 TaxID=2497860 RepID=UPI000F8D4353|nr:hypothetical protein [Cellulosilyticum sp. WCF-2]QEH67399.1 hypothetical protein EKH84_02685 [Cellulosilyticum sp. WCF-2]